MRRLLIIALSLFAMGAFNSNAQEEAHKGEVIFAVNTPLLIASTPSGVVLSQVYTTLPMPMADFCLRGSSRRWMRSLADLRR